MLYMSKILDEGVIVLDHLGKLVVLGISLIKNTFEAGYINYIFTQVR